MRQAAAATPPLRKSFRAFPEGIDSTASMFELGAIAEAKLCKSPINYSGLAVGVRGQAFSSRHKGRSSGLRDGDGGQGHAGPHFVEGRRSRREQTPLALAMIDIDHFKQINDQYGHSVGDTCIRHVAQMLHSLLKRPSDDLCRYGGEEFAIILPNTETEGAGQLIESIRQQLADTPCIIDNESISLTLSGGVASAIISHEDAEIELLKLADERLYAAKQAGRNRVVVTSVKPH